MRRHMLLICLLLKYVEEKSNGMGKTLPAPLPGEYPGLENYTMEQIGYHLALCEQAGYLEYGEKRGERAGWLTWNGHEALDRLCAEYNR